MQINNNFLVIRTNKTDVLIKKSKIQIEESKEQANDVVGYYEKLCKKFPDCNFRLEDDLSSERGYKGSFHEQGENFGSPQTCSINLPPKIIDRMMKEPDYADFIERNIQSIIDTFPAFVGMGNGEPFVSVSLAENGRCAITRATKGNNTLNNSNDYKEMLLKNRMNQYNKENFENLLTLGKSKNNKNKLMNAINKYANA